MKKILIVEDEESLIKPLEKKFSGEGYAVFTAQNGKEALEVLEGEKPDLILLDMVMPIMGGIAFLEEVEKDDSLKGIPVIVLTNLSGINTVSGALSKGVNDFLIKTDWSLEDVVKRVKDKIGE